MKEGLIHPMVLQKVEEYSMGGLDQPLAPEVEFGPWRPIQNGDASILNHVQVIRGEPCIPVRLYGAIPYERNEQTNQTPPDALSTPKHTSPEIVIFDSERRLVSLNDILHF